MERDTAGIQCSPFGVIPKKGKPGRWRLIVNLSAPEGHSVNDGIDRELSSVAYTSVDDVIRRVLELGEDALIAKADVKAAYRNIPVHPRDRWLRLWSNFLGGGPLTPAPCFGLGFPCGVEWTMSSSRDRFSSCHLTSFNPATSCLNRLS